MGNIKLETRFVIRIIDLEGEYIRNYTNVLLFGFSFTFRYEILALSPFCYRNPLFMQI